MPRVASLLPERYRDPSKSPLEQVACALRDCGFTAYTSGGAHDKLDMRSEDARCMTVSELIASVRDDYRCEDSILFHNDIRDLI